VADYLISWMIVSLKTQDPLFDNNTGPLLPQIDDLSTTGTDAEAMHG